MLFRNLVDRLDANAISFDSSVIVGDDNPNDPGDQPNPGNLGGPSINPPPDGNRPPLDINPNSNPRSTFLSLEQRFNQKVNALYADATLKFDQGKPSNFVTDEPYLVRYPGEDQPLLKYEDRSLPVVSTLNDAVRLTLFTSSDRGRLFIQKQRLLQTGNTFTFSRKLNQNFILENSIPFQHKKRSVRPLSLDGFVGWITGIGRTPTTQKELSKIGQLQHETYYNVLGNFNLLTALLKLSVSGIELNAMTAARSVGENKSWSQSRPELVRTNSPRKDNPLNWRNRIEAEGQIYQVKALDFYANAGIRIRDFNIVPFQKYFSSQGIVSLTGTQIRSGREPKSVVKPNSNSGQRRIRYLFDASQLQPFGIRKDIIISDPYKKLSVIPNGKKEAFEDPIIVSIAMGSDNHVQFRAFITNLELISNPTYKQYQYIGRIEKFIAYNTVQREVMFTLNVIAFSKDELDSVWRKINYITGLTFPYGFNRGIMQPNIARLTLGNVFIDQPGYFENISTNFSNVIESWDIDEQVPMGATITMKFVLIEKATRIASSPLYGITENSKDPLPFKKYLTPPSNPPKTNSKVAPSAITKSPENPNTPAPEAPPASLPPAAPSPAAATSTAGASPATSGTPSTSTQSNRPNEVITTDVKDTSTRKYLTPTVTYFDEYYQGYNDPADFTVDPITKRTVQRTPSELVDVGYQGLFSPRYVKRGSVADTTGKSPVAPPAPAPVPAPEEPPVSFMPKTNK